MRHHITTLFIAVLVVGLGYFGLTKYVQIANGQSSSLVVTTSASSTGATAAGRQVLALLNQLQAIQLDTSLFSNPAYQSLQDDTVPITPQPVGRPNPFLPATGVTTGTTGSTKTPTVALPKSK